MAVLGDGGIVVDGAIGGPDARAGVLAAMWRARNTPGTGHTVAPVRGEVLHRHLSPFAVT
jgi:hypothetical protein